MGRERAYLMHHTVAGHVSDTLPVVHRDISLSELRERMAALSAESAVIVDGDYRYLGLVLQHQLHDQHDSSSVASIEIEQSTLFNETTSIWDAMETMREYIGVAVPVIDSVSGRYLGAIPEAVVINAYLDAAQELRREEYEV
jgi:CBS domain-containing protein